MSRVKVVDNLPAFVRNNTQVMSAALSRMANDIKQVSKIRVPFKTGQLQKSGQVRKKGELHMQVVYDEDYAGYQERGRRADGSREVRKYTTPSTGKNFLKNAGKQIAKDFVNFIKQAASRVKV